MITTFIFDNDGVVVNSEPLYDNGIAEFLARRGYISDRDAIKHLTIGQGFGNFVRVARKHYGFFPGSDEELLKEFIEIVVIEFTKHISYVPGFENFFAKIKDSYKTGIATTSGRELLAISQKNLNLFDLFSNHVYSSTGLNLAHKPNPDIFLYVADKLGSKPEQCVVVEDAPAGLEAARRAGMKSIGLAGTISADHLTAADMVVDSYDEIDLDELNSL